MITNGRNNHSLGNASTALVELLIPRLRLGVVSSIRATGVRINLSQGGAAGASLLEGSRYGLGEVGEFVIVEGEVAAVLGRIIEVRLPERDRRSVDADTGGGVSVDAVAEVQLLGTIALDTLAVSAGIATYPRLGDRVFSAPGSFLSLIPKLMMLKEDEESDVVVNIGKVRNTTSGSVSITPEKLFGRHCAILGATGGGKSYTLARLIEECCRFQPKIILLDATGEYRDLPAVQTGLGLGQTRGVKSVGLPPNTLIESDFVALFQPSGKVQEPVLRSAIRSLRLVQIMEGKEDKPIHFTQANWPGQLFKRGMEKNPISLLQRDPKIAKLIEDPSQEFDVSKLATQIGLECVNETPWADKSDFKWGDVDKNAYGLCMPMITRINNVTSAEEFRCIFDSVGLDSLTDIIASFLRSRSKVLRVSLARIPFQFNAREIIANAIGRILLMMARHDSFRSKPLLLFVDEAHNFLGRSVGRDESAYALDSFELIAKEGRKYGLNLCLATQRPRDITESILSQMGTLIVHRLTNDRDRDVVERACGEIDKAASAFLPNLAAGEAAIVGVDFPIPLTVQIEAPRVRPHSKGADYQRDWKIRSPGK